MPHSRLGVKRKWAEHVAKTRARNTKWSQRANAYRDKRLSSKQRIAVKTQLAREAALTQFSTSTGAFLAAVPKVNTSGSGRSTTAGHVAGTYGQTKSSLFRRLKRKLRDIRQKQLKQIAIDNSPPDNTDEDIFKAADDREVK